MTTHLDSFETYRRYLFSIAYRMTGSAGDADDILQDAYLRYINTPLDRINEPKKFLTGVVTRTAIDAYRKLRREREHYKGVWLPQVMTVESENRPEAELEKSESLSMAMLHLLERLNATERAAFLLRDVFDLEYKEISEILSKPEPACRQLVSRSRKAVKSDAVRWHIHPAEHRRFFRAFTAAIRKGDLDALISILQNDITLYTDGGGRVKAAILPVKGPRSVGRFLINVAKKKTNRGLFPLLRVVNGEPALVLVQKKTVKSVTTFTFSDGCITAIYTQMNPDKLKYINIRKNWRDYLNLLYLS